MVLGCKRFRQPWVAHAHPEHPPAAIATGQQAVEDQGLVGTVEGAQAEVHHADGA
jgi:hypothetical protein